MAVSMKKNTINIKRMQAGLSLIELMIALVLGLILTLGVTQVFLSTKQTSRLTNGLATVQENIRFAIQRLQDNVRGAGHAGCLIGSPDNQLDTSNAAYDPTIYSGPAVIGWEAKGTGVGDSITMSSFSTSGGTWSNGAGNSIPSALSGNVVANTDFLIVNGSSEVNTTVDNINSHTFHHSPTSTLPKGAIVIAVAGDCSGGEMFQQTDNASVQNTTMSLGGTTPGNTTNKFSVSYDNNVKLYRYRSTAYYIGIGTDGNPGLFSKPLAGTAGTTVELVDGVDNMQVLYGVTTNGVRSVDKYLTAAGVTDWNKVVSVRIALLTRNNDSVTDSAEAKKYNLLGTEVTTASDRFARLVGVSTIALRNRLE